jgi:hypothetical protein
VHPYSTDSWATWKPAALLGVVAVVVSGVLTHLFGLVYEKTGFYIATGAPFAISGALFVLFDRYLWKLGTVRRILLVPDLNGTWRCAGRTVSKAGAPADYAWTADITIEQSWTKILITQRAQSNGRASSVSASNAASISRCGGGSFRLLYHYHNTPKVDQPDLREHSGLCRLVFDSSGQRAEGDYFTDRDRITVGQMVLERLETKR